MLQNFLRPKFTSFNKKLERFVPGQLFKPTLTNTLDDYENS